MTTSVWTSERELGREGSDGESDERGRTRN